MAREKFIVGSVLLRDSWKEEKIYDLRMYFRKEHVELIDSSYRSG
jgi:hypothetical protein